METQRLEEARTRKNDEIDYRNLQQRTDKQIVETVDKKVISRLFAKDLLKNFKRDTLRLLTDFGTLRRPQQFSMDTHFVPQLYGQI